MESVSEHYSSMVQAIRRYAPYVDMAKVDSAFHYAENKHKEQKRKDGSPYIIHPLATAEIVAEIGLDTDAILGALLHDCIEDTDSTFDEITRLFGKTVAELVEGVTKADPGAVFHHGRAADGEPAQDVHGHVQRHPGGADQNCRPVAQHPDSGIPDTGKAVLSKSMETMEIYAPLAHRLGMQKIKWELEDLSLKYIDPDGYHEIMMYLASHEAAANQFMRGIQTKITTRLSSVGIHGSIYGRIKHVYSIYRKMKSQNKTIDELYDLYAFRVIVDSITDCYNVLGHIHDLFNLVPGRFKDYISTPKPNMYQSLHTTVIGSDGIPFEVQIRTWEMHQTAEYGIAAHWKYKQNVNRHGDEQEYEWIRRLLENQQDTEAEDYIHSLKTDMFDDEVFVFTPKGQVISLPAGSTPIDFAYAIHSAVGNSMVGAKVNNRIVSYDVTLKNGDIVEVLTSKTAKGPSRDWLNICKSNQARNKIKQWFKRERREENVIRGKASFEAELRRINSINPAVLQNDELQAQILKKLSFESLEELYAAIGYGGLTAVKAVNRIREELLHAGKAVGPAKEEQLPFKLPPAPAKNTLRKNSGITVEGIEGCMVKLSRCCTPVPGDDIIGFITKGYGVSIHRKDCPNAQCSQRSGYGRSLGSRQLGRHPLRAVFHIAGDRLLRPRRHVAGHRHHHDLIKTQGHRAVRPGFGGR